MFHTRAILGCKKKKRGPMPRFGDPNQGATSENKYNVAGTFLQAVRVDFQTRNLERKIRRKSRALFH